MFNFFNIRVIILIKEGIYMIRVGTMFLPNNITFLRKKLKMTQQQLADLTGLSMNYISKIESKKMQRGFSLLQLEE